MSARMSALRVLSACQNGGAWADAALMAELNRKKLPAQDSALTSRLVYGVMQTQMLLDYYLSSFCSQRLEHLQQPLPNILRIGAYQILFLDRVPDRAAVNESVRLAKEAGRGAAAGLVNAVLRELARNKRDLPPLPADPSERISVQTSHPRWLVERMAGILGLRGAEDFLVAGNQIAPITILVNPLKTTADDLRRALSGAGIQAKAHEWVPDCLELGGVGSLTALPSFCRGEFTVQDAAAQLVSHAAGVRSGMRVLDVCAAPGGKAFSAAFAMRDSGSVTACDLHEKKLGRIREGAERLGITCIDTVAADGRIFHPEWEKRFDAVICDVPCSGLGIIRKKPDIRYKKPDTLVDLPGIQCAILDNASRYVKPGGVLMYSTCTVLPDENTAVTDAFFMRHETFRYEGFELPNGHGSSDGFVTLWPHLHRTDGFYIAKMRRRA